MIGQHGVAVPGIELLNVDLDGRSLQIGQPTLEEPIHDLFIQAGLERLRCRIPGFA